ncbi:hypothetical protein EVAR_97848_1 [Eumeta japonica]|uniref:Uncharacterized protein n=1 Tax=Eumeta variegata TaxID=151549 RepID=A0A4C1WXP2_EUMVA|nr:hypothetical protein EVAR_97848_1 [Eumeta japonica]
MATTEDNISVERLLIDTDKRVTYQKIWKRLGNGMSQVYKIFDDHLGNELSWRYTNFMAVIDSVGRSQFRARSEPKRQLMQIDRRATQHYTATPGAPNYPVDQFNGSSLLSRALSAAIESRNSVTKIKPNTPHSGYRVARPSGRLTYVYGTTVQSSHGSRRAAPASDEYSFISTRKKNCCSNNYTTISLYVSKREPNISKSYLSISRHISGSRIDVSKIDYLRLIDLHARDPQSAYAFGRDDNILPFVPSSHLIDFLSRDVSPDA